MAINFSTQVYSPTYDVFARPVTFTPAASQPNAAAYAGRGIYGTVSVDAVGVDGSLISDQRTILDIREAEFTIVPIQGDRVFIPADSGMPELGTFEIVDTNANGGGETTCFLRRWITASP